MPIPIHFEGIAPEVIDEFVKGRQARTVLALKQAGHDQRLIARQVGEHRAVDGLGAPILAIDPTAFHYWGSREGYGCWADRGFLREFGRDNPEARIKSAGGTRIQVGWTGGEKRWAKRYD